MVTWIKVGTTGYLWRAVNRFYKYLEKSMGHGLGLDLEGDKEKDWKDEAHIFSLRQFVPFSETGNTRGIQGKENDRWLI